MPMKEENDALNPPQVSLLPAFTHYTGRSVHKKDF